MDYISEGFVQALVLIISMDTETWTAVTTTVRLTAISMVATLLIGLPFGLMLGYSDFPGKRVIRTAVETLLALPTVVVGLLVYAFISNRGPFGRFGLLFTITGMAIGQTILALPIVIALTASAVEGLDDRLKMTLSTLGASAWRMAATSLFEARLLLLMAGMTAYGRIVAEVGVSMMLGGNIKWHTRTITTAITLETGKGDFVLGMALGMILLAISFILNACLSFLKRRTVT
jgi:tungstate transport system permease protein